MYYMSHTATSVLLILNFVLILVIHESYQECQCNMRFNGEYCGIELNKVNGNNDCPPHMYYCGKTNRGKPAVLLMKCQRGLECNRNVNGGNACLMGNLQCSCGQGLRRRRKYCGSQLTGSQCGPNVVYKCPMFRRYNPKAEDGCPYGCRDGQCVDDGDRNTTVFSN